MSLSRDGLLTTIKKLKQVILQAEANSNSLTEMETRQGLINPLFRGLGWDFSDFTAVRSEFRHAKYNEVVDYALFCDSNSDEPVLLIEAKMLNRNLNDVKIIKQLCSYLGQIGVQWGVLTDGNKYVMYNTNAGLSFEDQKFLTLQIKTADTEDGIPSEELVDKLIALLSHDSLKNGGIQKFYKEHVINRHIEEAMWSLFSEPFDTLALAIKREFKQERVADPRLKITTRQIIAYFESMKDDEGRIPLSFEEGAAPGSDNLLQEVATLSQQKNADAGTIVRASRVTIFDLLTENLIQAGDNWRFEYKGEITWGRITENGEIAVNGISYPSPSKAGSAIKGKTSCNGWVSWRYKNERGEWRRVQALREQYRSKHGSEAKHGKKDVSPPLSRTALIA